MKQSRRSCAIRPSPKSNRAVRSSMIVITSAYNGNRPLALFLATRRRLPSAASIAAGSEQAEQSDNLALVEPSGRDW